MQDSGKHVCLGKSSCKTLSATEYCNVGLKVSKRVECILKYVTPSLGCGSGTRMGT